MTKEEWESLCDQCGRCCLIKLEDEDTGEFLYSDVRCVLLCENSSKCKDYKRRKEIVPDCIKLTPQNIGEIKWIPNTCAYLKLAKGQELSYWHPLVAGDTHKMKKAGVFISQRHTLSSNEITDEEYIEHIVEWPNLEPKEG